MTDPGDSLTSAELTDNTDAVAVPAARIDRTVLTNPLVLRALGAIVIGLAIVLWPTRSNVILSRLLGAAVCWLAIGGISTALRRRPRRWLMVLGGLAGMAVGAFLLINPNQSGEFLGRLLGAVALLYAAQLVWRQRQHSKKNGANQVRASVILSTAVSLTAVGLLLFLFPEQALGALTTVVAIAWIAVSVLVVIASLDADTDGVVSYQRAVEVIGRWLIDRPKSVDARQALYDKILYEGPYTRQRVVRFFALMSFAAVIASMGVITDSTAVVIGAMLIAPLMTPLMGMAISLVMGWPNRLKRSTAMALGGIACAIAIGVLLGLSEPSIINTATNSQILGRSSPTTADLITALAAGAAGAYGLSRPDVSDSLPGVAIAISLVPPLTVVGIAYSQGDWRAGNGALLLFATNMLAILVMGGLTFVATGVTPIAQVAANQHRVRTSVSAVIVLAALVLGALFLNSSQLTRSLLDQQDVDAAVKAWLGADSGHQAVSSTVDADTVSVVVTGPADGLGDPQQLADELGLMLERSVNVDIRLIVEERISATAGG